LVTSYTPISKQFSNKIKMARPHKSRKISNPPKMKGFKPYGMPMCKIEPVILKLEEYESIKLVNYDRLPQDQAAIQMNVSRPTFTRIYNSALELIAKAFIEGKAIEIEGGNYELEKDWYRCRKCFKLIEGLGNHTKCKNCTLYGENELIKLN
jgi:predicted DNA-binding protein (UPF0251 family)